MDKVAWELPVKTDWMREQMDHEGTRSYAEEIYFLVKKHSYRNALEIGAAWGVSALAILAAGKGELASVDPIPNVHAIEEVEVNGLRDRWAFHNMTSDRFFTQNEVTYDLIYIDGSHKYENVKPDLFNSWDALNSGGLLIADDYVHPGNQRVDKDGTTVEYGVSYALWELVADKGIDKIGTKPHIWWTVKP